MTDYYRLKVLLGEVFDLWISIACQNEDDEEQAKADRDFLLALIDRHGIEHDELVRLRAECWIDKKNEEYFEHQYNKLFDYWNDKYPDEMSEYIKDPGIEEGK